MKWRVLCVLLVCIVAAFLPLSPVSTWMSTQGDAAAPQLPSDQGNPNEARRAAGEANTQAGFLTQGTKELVDGTSQLTGGADELVAAISQAQAGAQELSAGMVQLQAATGQLGGGATEVADAIGQVVEQATAFDAVRGQVTAAIDRALVSTKASKDPDVIAAREQLQQLKVQTDNAQLPPEVVSQMNKLRDGSREVANQLAVPGYAYHDGVYTATNGAQQLANGLTQLNNEAQGAVGGITQLDEGVAKIDHMANLTAEQIRAVRGALPAPAAAQAGAEGAAQEPQESSLAPVAAMLVAALVGLGGVGVAAAAWLSRTRRWLALGLGVVLLAVAGWVLVFILGHNLSPAVLGIAALALLCGAAASTGVTTALAALLGRGWGTLVAAILAISQMGVVGWVWKAAAAAPVSGALEALSSAMPMHWLAASLSSAGNNGSVQALWIGIGMSALVAAVGLLGGVPQRSRVAVHEEE